MLRSLIVILFFLLAFNALAQSPHGDKLRFECDACHTVEGWKHKKNSFDHTKTNFPLIGQHRVIICRKCHVNLVFANTKPNCVSCHKDIHQQTVGQVCERCHTPESWGVKNIVGVHRESMFALNGKHSKADCFQCHKSASLQRYDPIGTACADCHSKEYYATSKPSHTSARYPKDCFLCHNENLWQSAIFNHNTSTGFPLKDGHFGVECIKCHPSGYTKTSTTCLSCHLTAYNETTSPAHIAAKFSTDCKTCHSEKDWKTALFNHSTATTFPLTGSHVGLSCISCHSKGYAGISTDCASCHQTNFNATTDPGHVAAKFTTDCKICHTVKSWKPAIFNHNTNTTFLLNGGHAGVACTSCHSKSYTGTSKVCSSCHLTNFNATTNPGHIAAKFSHDCELCHSEKSWKQTYFNHTTSTNFPLTGSHIGVGCLSCHPKIYAGTGMECVSCHLTKFNATTTPSHVSAKYPTDCKLCHTVNTWSPSIFDHNVNTTFQLTGAHVKATCAGCHATGYKGTSAECVSCHLVNYSSTKSPSHSAARFPTDCKKCHNPTAWTPNSFNHNTATRFFLSGSHIGVTCIKCHPKDYAGTNTECNSCHQNNFIATTSPSHIAAKYPSDCKICHTSTGWKPSIFNHNVNTTFQLTGAHVKVACASCHPAGYTGTSAQCASCHLATYTATKSPSHSEAKFPTDCSKCHTTTAWRPNSFNHNTATTFAINGKHIGVTCISCHSKGYAGTSTLCINCHTNSYNTTIYPNHVTARFPFDCKACHTALAWTPSTFNHHSNPYPLTDGNAEVTCISCHQNDYNSTSNPDHAASKFSTDCRRCHVVTNWLVSVFNHNTETTFPLTGGHLGKTCISCHSKGYAGTSIECVTCHQTNFNATTDPGHVAAMFSTDCKPCHNSNAWIPAIFNHTTGTTFPLTGSHKEIACVSCHAKGFVGISTACVNCHLTDYNATTAPGHSIAKFPTDCIICHATTDWKPALFDHNTGTMFPLTGGHTGVTCISCHQKGYSGTSTACVSCHQNSFNATTNPGHIAAKFSSDCKICHTATTWKPAKFDHNTATAFPLAGAHIGLSCISCHSKGYAGIATTCVSCHQTNFNSTTNPGHVVGKFSTDCKTCHTVTAWTPATFNHTTGTTFPLTGAHTGVACINCHSKGYNGVSTACMSCHLTNYNSTTNPGHIAGKFSTDCKTCHTSTAWSPASFNHTTGTTFPLTGAHVGVSCINCHSKGYVGISTACSSCHLTDYNASTSPAHATAKFPTTCETCHTTKAWTPSTFNHNTSTTFPLVGAHIGVSCINCHSKGYVGIATTCVSCHQNNYNASTNPGHVAAKFPTDCKLCHTVTAWIPGTFNHTTSTTFPLTGAHIGISCINCHSKGYAGIATTCVSCHQTDYNSTTKPGHIAGKFSTDCKTCHTVTAWSPATFNHTTGTSFPLTGAHTGVACINCHSTGYVGISTTCVSCHLTNYNSTNSPGHVAAKISTDCKTCHTVTAWSPATFNHTTGTTFPLTGAHVGVSCINCHSKGYVGISTACSSCHLTDYNTSTSPAHATAKFPTTCESCHTVTAWTPSTFNHNTSTTFPLTGAHIGVTCISCHSKGYAGIATTCVSCHQTDYNSSTNPGHVAAKFSTDCKTCHTVTAWSPATFNHTTGTTFPLTGAHIGVSCINCHSKGYVGIPTACSSCHLTDYNASTSPAHATAKFPTTCETCHTTKAWTPSTFNHNTSTTFPLAGAHIGVSCISCHSKGYAGIATTCVSCHQTNYNATTNPGHVAEKFSTDCKTCHTVTAWVPSTFNHTTSTTFPLTGSHIGVTCISCHSKGYAGIATTCVSCHLTDYNSTTNPAHAAAKFPTTCESCHTITVWTSSTFNHDSQYFRINSGNHNGEWTLCSECHTNATNYAVFNCLLCHEHSTKTSVDSDHKGVSGYVYNSTNCLSCHPKV